MVARGAQINCSNTQFLTHTYSIIPWCKFICSSPGYNIFVCFEQAIKQLTFKVRVKLSKAEGKSMRNQKVDAIQNSVRPTRGRGGNKRDLYIYIIGHLNST